MSDCGVCLYADGDMAEVFTQEVRRARKPYVCCECGNPVVAGDRYQMTSLLYDGAWDKYRTCLICAEIRKAFYCEGELLGNFWDDMLMGDAFAEMTVGCLNRLTTPEAKAELMRRWQQWKGLR